VIKAIETIKNSDGTVDFAGQWVMLEALSDVGGALNAEALAHSTTNRYDNPEQAGMFLDAADMLVGQLAGRDTVDVEETSLAAQALAWNAANTANADNKAAALAKMAELGVAPVFASEVSWDGSARSVTDANFDTAGAMHASNEFIWFHNDEVNGFPEVP